MEKPQHAGVRQDGREGGGESEAIGQHVLRAGLAEFLAKPVVPVEDLADDGFGAGRVHVALFHGGARREPAAGIDVGLDLREIGREIFLHKPVAVGAAEIEDIVGIFFEELEIILHRFANIFVDDLGIFPAPLRIQVGVTDHVQGWLRG